MYKSVLKSFYLTKKMYIRKICLFLYFYLLTNVLCNDSFKYNQQNNSYYFEIQENTIENQLIGKINLTKGYIYSFGGNQSPPEFKFNSQTGEIFTTKINLDRERQQFYDLILLSNLPLPTQPIEVKVKVIDQNDNYPFWLWDVNKIITISESAPLGTKIILDTAVDVDEDQLRYELVFCNNQFKICLCDTEKLLNNHLIEDQSDDPFKLIYNQNNSILSLELIQRLDRENIQNYNCKLCVFDLKNQSNYVNLNIAVLDVNDNIPIFDKLNYTAFLNSSLKKEDFILNVHATDLDEALSENSKISYFIHNENNSLNNNYNNIDDFYINSTTGDIFVNNDGIPKICQTFYKQISTSEKTFICVFTVLAEDNGNPKQIGRSYVTIYLSLKDNLNKPEIKILYYNHRFLDYALVDQSAVYGTAVAAISVYDEDFGNNGKTKLEISSGNELENFFLDSEFESIGSYVIRVNKILSNKFRTQNIYNLTIKAFDFGQPSLSSEKSLIIKVNEVLENDHRPAFNQLFYNVEIDEISSIGSFVCLINSNDSDKSDSDSIVYYSLNGNNSDYFHIDSQTGLVTLAKQLDRESIPYFELKVFLRDTHSNSKWSSSKLFVKVIDINDNYPQLKFYNVSTFEYETFNSSSSKTFQVQEGNFFNLNLKTYDLDEGDNGLVNIELLFNYQNIFELEKKEDSIRLYSTKQFDYEQEKDFELLILVSDQGTPKLINTFKINLNVLDRDDNLPLIYPKNYFVDLYNFSSKNQLLTKINLVDKDQTSSVKFSFNFNHNHKNLNFVNNLINLDENTGNVYLKKSFNVSLFPSYIPINITCDGCERFNNQATIHLFLNKRIEYRIKDEFITLSESTDPKIVFKFNESFKSYFNNEIDYELFICDGDIDQSFLATSEHIELIKKLDYEKKNIYNLSVCAFNSQNFLFLNFNIQVLNENDLHPIFTKPFYFFQVLRNTPYHTNLFKLISLDLDDDKEITSNIVYYFENVNEKNNSLLKKGNKLFRINKDQFEINVNLFEGNLINGEFKYNYKNDEIYSTIICVKDLNVKTKANSQIQFFVQIIEAKNNIEHLFKSLEFKKTFFELNVKESTPINSQLLKLNIFDQININDLKIEFLNKDNNSILVKNQFGLFPDGTLYLKSKLDYETKENYLFQILISLKEYNLNSKIINILIHVLDINDNQPEFEKEVYEFDVYENSDINTLIGTVKANDKDQDDNSIVKYKIIDSNFSSFIEVESFSGKIYLKKEIDFEKIKKFQFEVEAKDQSLYEKKLKNKCLVLINILDVNDNVPCFEIYNHQLKKNVCSDKVTQRISIMENLKLNSTIFNFKVKDSDLNSNINFNLLKSEFSNKFNLNSQTGILKLIENLDREVSEKIELMIKVDDGLHFAFNKLIITLNDVNDNAPLFLKNKNFNNTLSLNENLEPGTILFSFDATDYDVGYNSKFYFEISSLESINSNKSNECGKFYCQTIQCFKIEDNNLILINNLDYESEIEHTINITAIDNYGLKSDPLSLKIIVNDINDCKPEFKKDNSTFINQNEEIIQIFENLKKNSLIKKIEAFDCDSNDKLSYSLIKCQVLGSYYKLRCPVFLNESTGEIYSSDILDYEEIKRINLKIKVSDKSDNNDVKDLSLLIKNLNDNQPKFLTTTSLVIVRQFYVKKNETLAQLKATDLDHDKIIYKITKDSNFNYIDEYLFLDENDGFIYAKKQIRQNTFFKIPILIIDEGGLFTNDLIDLVILVTNNTIENLSLNFNVFENEPIETFIHKFSCTSLSCKYFINTCNKLFNINSFGELKTRSILDRELKNVYYFDVFVLNDYLIQVYKIKIIVLDRNDNKPKLLNNAIEKKIRVKENERLKNMIFDFSSIVTDFDLDTQFKFKIINCKSFLNEKIFSKKNCLETFIIDENNGKIFLNHELDKEKESSYRLTISVFDGSFEINEDLIIEIIDVNDNYPFFKKNYYSFYVLENTKEKTIVGKIDAEDLDEKSILKYKIISEQENSPIKINEKTGLIYLSRSVDYETDNNLYITMVQASDGEFTSLPTTIYLNILNTNDNEPIFEKTFYKFYFNESQKLENLFCLIAKDYDNDKLTYSFYEDEDDEQQVLDKFSEKVYFNVNNSNGCVKLLKHFNSTEKNIFKFKISVNDGIYFDLTSIEINIYKNKTIENYQANNNELVFNISENFKINDVVFKFKEHISLVDDDLFKINSKNELILIKKPDKMCHKIQLKTFDQIKNILINFIPSFNKTLKFEKSIYIVDIKEDYDLNLNILSLKTQETYDDDLLTLEIVSGNTNGQFLIIKNNLILKYSLDYEKIKSYNLSIKVNNFENEAFTNVYINVLNVYDEKPIFFNSPYYFKWPENTVGELFKFLAKSEFDIHSDTSISNLKFLLKNNIYDFFNLDTNTGVLNVIKELDYESLKNPVLTLELLVMDELNGNLQNEIEVKIEIINMNDNSPSLMPVYNKDLNENIRYEQNFKIIQLNATDLDNDVLTYKLINCTSKGFKNQCSKIDINQIGELVIKENLVFDRELEEEYKITIKVSDGLYEKFCSINVLIIDENDVKPQINTSQPLSKILAKSFIKSDFLNIDIPYQYFISDSYMKEKEYLFLLGFNAFDSDKWNSLNSKIIFKSPNIDSKKYKINKESGVVTILNNFINKLDTLKNKTVNFELLLSDSSLKQNLSKKIEVQLQMFNLINLKWMTIFEPFLNDINIYENLSIDSLIHEFILINFSKTKTDNIEINIVGGDYDNRFKVVKIDSFYKLLLNKILDYEHAQNYTVFLEATFKPQNEEIIFFQVLELNIRILNVNDNAPKFSQNFYNVTILEEKEPELFVMKLEANDLDDNELVEKSAMKKNDELEEEDFDNESIVEKSISNYNLENNLKFEILTQNVPFKIDEQTGIILTTQKIDREENDKFELLVQVHDDEGLKSQATVLVNVEDINDCPPKMTQIFRVNISENEEIGSYLTQITFNDKDIYTPKSHLFSITDDRFKINKYTGEISLAKKLDREETEEIELVVTVNDGSWKQKTTLTVFINDENDNAPVFENCNKVFLSSTYSVKNHCFYYFELNEYFKNNQSIGKLSAYDLDKELNSIITFSLNGISNYVTIDKDTGSLYINQNYLNSQLVSLKVSAKACDNGLVPKCSFAEVFITKNNKNDFKLSIPLSLKNLTQIYTKNNKVADSESFGFCVHKDSNQPTEYFRFENNSLIFNGQSKVKINQKFSCKLWSIAKYQEFTNLVILITKNNFFQPQFKSKIDQINVNETSDSSLLKNQFIYQFKVLNNELYDGFINEIIFKLELVSLKYHPNALQYYFNKYKTDSEEEKFFGKSIEALLYLNDYTQKILDPFIINKKNGSLYLNYHLDYELVTSYKYKIIILDNSTIDKKNNSLVFEILVSNIDDNLPMFLTSNGLVKEIDLDINQNFTFENLKNNFTLTDFDDANLSLDNFDFIKNKENLNKFFEKFDQSKKLIEIFEPNTTNQILELIEKNNLSKNHSLRIHLTLSNTTSFKPKFSEKLFEFDLLERSKIGTIITNLNFTVLNQNNQKIKFQLLKPIVFGIDLRKNGDLVVTNEVDFESFSMNEIYKQTQKDNLTVSFIKLKFTVLVMLENQQVITPQDFDKAELLINLIDLNEPPMFVNITNDCLIVKNSGSCAYQFVNKCSVKAIDYDQNDYIRYRLISQNHLFSIDEIYGTINLINCNLTNLYLTQTDNNIILEVLAIDSSELFAKTNINIRLNWQQKNSYQSYIENKENIFNIEKENSLVIPSNDSFINSWCLKSTIIPKSNSRMTCYRKNKEEYCCECVKPYQGKDCKNEDLCYKDEYCENGGLCIQNEFNKKICLCKSDFRGSRCEQALNYCTKKAGRCGVNGVCQLIKPYGHRCNCLDDHTFGHECSQFSLGMRPQSYIRLNVSLHEATDEISMTFASHLKITDTEEENDYGQLMLYNNGKVNKLTGKSDFIALILYKKHILLRIGGNHLLKINELKVYANNYDLLDGKYYKFNLIRNRKVAHLSLYSCEKMFLDNQLNCNNLMNQSSISFNQASFHFDSNPLYIGGLEYVAGNNNLFYHKTKGHVTAKSNFIGCLYKTTLNSIKINEFISEKSFVDPICRPQTVKNEISKEINKGDNNVVEDCGSQALYLKKNWFENKCKCFLSLSNSSSLDVFSKKLYYESYGSCNESCDIQMNKDSVIKLNLTKKWNSLIKNQNYESSLEDFIIRIYSTSFYNNYQKILHNNYLSIRIIKNGSLVMENLNKKASVLLNGSFKLNQWNVLSIKSNGEIMINKNLNYFNTNLFKLSLKPIVIGSNLTGCISHLILNGHLIHKTDDNLYQLISENVDTTLGCKNVFEPSRINLDAISIGIILTIMFFVILILVLATSFMLFNNSSKENAQSSSNRSTLPNLKKNQFQPTTDLAFSNHLMFSNNYNNQEDYYEEPFYYGNVYFQHNEKLSNFNSNRSNFSRSQF